MIEYRVSASAHAWRFQNEISSPTTRLTALLHTSFHGAIVSYFLPFDDFEMMRDRVSQTRGERFRLGRDADDYFRLFEVKPLSSTLDRALHYISCRRFRVRLASVPLRTTLHTAIPLSGVIMFLEMAYTSTRYKGRSACHHISLIEAPALAAAPPWFDYS